jgi:hypothetical protein
LQFTFLAQQYYQTNTMPSGKSTPRWNDPELKAGTKIRTALWLLSEIGVGNIFTKEQHRSAFPGIVQADRRLRDLRPLGWIIHTSLEDVSLNSNEQRFVAAGAPIWDPASADNAGSKGLSANERRRVLAEAGYRCAVCGIAGGDQYSDTPWMSAILSITKRTLLCAGASSEVRYVAECKLCQSGGGKSEDVASLISQINGLSSADRDAMIYLARQAPDSPLLKAWAQYRQLSPVALIEVRKSILRPLTAED